MIDVLIDVLTCDWPDGLRLDDETLVPWDTAYDAWRRYHMHDDAAAEFALADGTTVSAAQVVSALNT